MANSVIHSKLEAQGEHPWRNIASTLRRFVLSGLVFVLLLSMFEWGLPALDVPTYLLPRPSRVLAEIVDPDAGLVGHLGATAAAGVSGLLISAGIGFALAVAFVQLRPLEDALYPWVIVSQTLPAAALAPLLTIWLGNGLAPRIAMAAIFAFFPVLVNTSQGLRRLRPAQLALLQAWGASQAQILRHLRLPACLPALFGGLKVAAALAVVGAIVGELAGAGRGLGYVISVATYHLDTARVFAAVTLASGLSLSLYGLLSLLERWIVFWQRPE